MAYLNMNQSYNRIATVTVYLLELIVAIAVSDVGIIF
jgi:hypothetical protein